MAIVAVIILAAILLVMISSENLQARNRVSEYYKTHPPHKYQEEFLKACELYLEYIKDIGRHPNPSQDAKCDAALYIKGQGFLPACLDSTEIYSVPQDMMPLLYADFTPSYMSFFAIEHVLRESFLSAQIRDSGITGYSFDQRFRVGYNVDSIEWNRYCRSMDSEFNKMVDRYEEAFKARRFESYGPKINQEDRSYQFYNYGSCSNTKNDR